jgi:hypothetical protein
MLENDLNQKNIVHFPCFGRILNWFINDGIKDISEILSNLRNLGRVIKPSSKETAKALKLNPLVLKRDTLIVFIVSSDDTLEYTYFQPKLFYKLLSYGINFLYS